MAPAAEEGELKREYEKIRRKTKLQLQEGSREAGERIKAAKTEEEAARVKEEAAEEEEEAAEEEKRAAGLRGRAAPILKGAREFGKATGEVGKAIRKQGAEAAKGMAYGAGISGRFGWGAAKGIGRATRWTGMAAGAGAAYAATSLFPFFIACVVVFLFEFGSQFSASVATRLILYLILALWASLGIFQSGEFQNFKAIAFSLGFYILFLIFSSMPGNISSIIAQALAVLSPFIIGILFQSFPFLISGIIFIGPMVKGLLLQTGIPVTSDFVLWIDIANVVFLGPLWIYYIILFVPKESFPPIARTIRAVLSMALLLLVVTSLYAPMVAYASNSLDKYQEKIDTYKVYGEASNFISANSRYMWNQAKKIPPTVIVGFKRTITGQLDVATAGTYSQNLEKQHVNNWVVTVSGQKVYYPSESRVIEYGQPVTISAVFKGKTNERYVDVDYMQQIDFGCRIREKTQDYREKGETDIGSAKLLNILAGEGSSGEQSIVCKTGTGFSGGRESGVVEIFGQVKLSPASRLDVVFIDPDEKYSITGTEKMRKYQLKPRAKPLTGGPVAIAAEFEETYPVSVEAGHISKLLITIEDYSIQQGRIVYIQGIKIKLPPGLELATSSIGADKPYYCSYSIEGSDDADGKTGFIYSAHEEGDDWLITPGAIKYPIDDYISLRCYINFPKNAHKELLEGLSVATKQIEIEIPKDALYYEIFGQAGVDVKPKPAAQPGTSPGTGATGSCPIAQKILKIAADEGITDSEEKKFILATAQQESTMQHCQKGGNECEETETDVKHNEGGDFGIMQINKIAHPECFTVTQRNSPPCDGELCRGKTALNLECNIEAGIRYYHAQYVACRDGAKAYCNYNKGPGNRCNIGQCAVNFNEKVTYVVKNFKDLIDNQDIKCPAAGDWIWPLPVSNNRITAVYGQYDSVHTYAHSGIDISAAENTPVYAVADGNVVFRCNDGDCHGYGNTATIQHGNDYVRYSHLNSIKVNIGQAVTKGSIIGYSGNTGYSFGAHLDIKVYPSKPAEFQYETPVDPLTKYTAPFLKSINLVLPDNQYAREWRQKLSVA